MTLSTTCAFALTTSSVTYPCLPAARCAMRVHACANVLAAWRSARHSDERLVRCHCDQPFEHVLDVVVITLLSPLWNALRSSSCVPSVARRKPPPLLSPCVCAFATSPAIVTSPAVVTPPAVVASLPAVYGYSRHHAVGAYRCCIVALLVRCG